ncbi:MAG: spore coat protein CotJB, partial [Lachnospiraceae bacterium]|nr:spore coat protein CotJB [Lachnospiraceae bacterium]
YNKARNRAVAEYSAQFGPLMVSEVSCDNEFKWATQPWPWEMEG